MHHNKNDGNGDATISIIFFSCAFEKGANKNLNGTDKSSGK
jgi:hypothetical protein